MNSVDLSVLKTLREWQAGNLPLWLASLLETFGSSPFTAGAMLAHLISVRNRSAQAVSLVQSLNQFQFVQQAQPINQEVCS